MTEEKWKQEIDEILTVYKIPKSVKIRILNLAEEHFNKEMHPWAIRYIQCKNCEGWFPVLNGNSLCESCELLRHRNKQISRLEAIKSALEKQIYEYYDRYMKQITRLEAEKKAMLDKIEEWSNDWCMDIQKGTFDHFFKEELKKPIKDASK